jgi:hypothetical protein
MERWQRSADRLDRLALADAADALLEDQRVGLA